jgi:kynurenine formamidase
MDALCHVAVDGHMYGGVSVADALQDGRYHLHGIDQVPPLVRRGILFDVPAGRGADRLAPGEPVRVEDLRAAGLRPEPGDVVLVRTGWARLWHDPAAYLGDARGVPGIDVGAASWLADHGAVAIGSDTIALEHIPAGGGLTSDLEPRRGRPQ